MKIFWTLLHGEYFTFIYKYVGEHLPTGVSAQVFVWFMDCFLSTCASIMCSCVFYPWITTTESSATFHKYKACSLCGLDVFSNSDTTESFPCCSRFFSCILLSQHKALPHVLRLYGFLSGLTFVSFQVWHLTESFPTVCSHVDLQVISTCEIFSTSFAILGLLTCVDSHMRF